MQSLQLPQFVNSQSLASSQGFHTLQNFISVSEPAGSFPQKFADDIIFLLRNVSPPPQEAEHGDHGSQSAHLPSMQPMSSLHGFMLQLPTSSLSLGEQAAPPPRGGRKTVRLRSLCPPPQDVEQVPHLDHSPHSQSCRLHAGFSRQSRVSPKLSSHPKPSASRSSSTNRLRICCPTPQVVEQPPQLSQSPTLQLRCSHSRALQPRVSTKFTGHSLPPYSANRTTCRSRRVCPPPQVRSHGAHAVQSVTSQSTGDRSHVAVSRRFARQVLPPFAGCRVMFRLRVFCPRTQWLHSAQSPISQSTASSHFSKLHGCVSTREPSNRVASPFAGCSSWRDRVWCPSPQDRLQVPQGLHVLSS